MGHGAPHRLDSRRQTTDNRSNLKARSSMLTAHRSPLPSTRLNAVKLLVLIALNAAAAWLTVWLVPGLEYSSGEWWRWLLFGAVIGLINAVIKPVAKLLTIPIRILTLGLFTLVINVGLMSLAIWIAKDANVGLTSESIWAVLLGGLVLTVVGSLLNLFSPD